MARKKNSKTRPFIIKFILITFLVAGIGFSISCGVIYLFENTKYFKIQSITIDPSLQFINKRDLRNLKGKNIFEIDLKAIQRRLSYKYPQASELKVMKRFPNRIAVVAKQRHPLAQVQIKDRIATLDEEGVVLSSGGQARKDLPLIVGVRGDSRKLVRGLPFKGADIQTALKITNLFQANKSLSSYSIDRINVENLSKIYFTLSNDLEVILDRNNTSQRIKVLGVVLSQGKLDMKHVKYIDLRFKEPIIGKK
ncbi:MAG: cell division protein FtsQ/DivIB [Candidatus Omnitrophica bacterium]|nr:cell division protein FtsQ/DivIB [Candidatus Omnitrophota bacterium]